MLSSKVPDGKLPLIDGTGDIGARKLLYVTGAAPRQMRMRDGTVLCFPGKHLKFCGKSRGVDAQLVMIQWQNGKPARFIDRKSPLPPVWSKGDGARAAYRFFVELY